MNGEVGDVRREWSLSRYGFGKSVVLGGQRVLSLSTTRARIKGGDLLGGGGDVEEEEEEEFLDCCGCDG